MSRLVGVADPADAVLATELYANVVNAPLVVTDWATAEVIKTAENAVRDVQIALGNQLAVICDYADVDYRRVRDQINRLWSGESLILEAGAGVGGHCLPKDPWLLISSLPTGAPAPLIRAARTMNDAMGDHVVRIVERAIEREGLVAKDARVAVLGLTYDANSDDTRNAPATRIIASLRALGIDVVENDPYSLSDADLSKCLAGADVAVLVIPHDTYRDTDWSALVPLMRHANLVDCRRAIDPDLARTIGLRWYGLGVGVLAR
jgi:UDP-N-acetyl-D-mannosaminuronic acid dehydrogenase